MVSHSKFYIASKHRLARTGSLFARPVCRQLNKAMHTTNMAAPGKVVKAKAASNGAVAGLSGYNYFSNTFVGVFSLTIRGFK